MTWDRHGECNNCGHCCEMFAREALVRTDLQVSKDRDFYKTRGFSEVQVDGEPRHVLFIWQHAPCPELKKSSWGYGPIYSCRVYETRPQTCRDFPIRPQQIVGTPCSYWFVDSDGNRVGGNGSPHATSAMELVALESVA